jgi:putative ABC transport system permease protein
VAATAALQGVARRRELATLRALGLRKRGLVLLLELEALWITSIGMLLGIVAGGVMAWVANRAIVVWQGVPEEGVPMLLTPALDSMVSSLAALLGTAALAALVPAIGAARYDVARGLDVLPAQPEY